MRSLFLKIFLSFWGAQALFLVLAILTVIALRPTREPGIESQATRVIAEAVSAYQSGGEKAAGEYLHDLEHAQSLHVYVFDSAGREISGRKVSPWVEDIRRNGHIHLHGWMDRFLPERFYRQIENVQGQDYTLVLEFPPGPRVFGPHGIPNLGILIAVISSGLVCYLLARSLTSPVPLVTLISRSW